MQISILTIFPQMFASYLSESILKRAQERGIVQISVLDLRQFTSDAHRSADDYPYGGGAGMIMKPEPIFRGVRFVADSTPKGQEPEVILLSPQGVLYTQKKAMELAAKPSLVLICGRYKGVDERVREQLVTEEISIGDYVLTGGELAAMVVVDSVVRLLPGVLGDPESALTDSFVSPLLDHPHYTRPEEFEGMRVPEILLSGNHEAIRRWRRKQSVRRTQARRPDLLKGVELSAEDLKFLKEDD